MLTAKDKMEKNVTFSFDTSSEPEEMMDKNFTFHIDVPISAAEAARFVYQTVLYYSYSKHLKRYFLHFFKCKCTIVND